ncbi:MAG TPA: VWA domain-containing protein [Terriglobia bacterium]|nr:VWA domain-containing protein [Terriglobia bacterium]
MKKLLLFLLFFCLAGGELLAQNSAGGAASTNSQSPGDQSRIQVRVELVNVLATVTDKKNRLITDLTKDDFRVFEDGKPQEIRFFSRETDLPLRIGMLIDTSNSVRDRLRFEQEAAIEFLNTALRPGKDLAFVTAFDLEPQFIQDYTDDIEKLSNAINSVKAGGVTSLYDAVFSSCKEKLYVFPPPEPYLRRVMIVISDGQDNQSVHSREEALSMAQKAEVTIYTISTNRSGAEGKGDNVLRRLAKETGGHAFFPFEAGDLAANFQEIARELRSQYSLAYVSTNTAHDGTFRWIIIQPVDSSMHVRAKDGYWALSP